jgi:diaminopimelate epimerase
VSGAEASPEADEGVALRWAAGPEPGQDQSTRQALHDFPSAGAVRRRRPRVPTSRKLPIREQTAYIDAVTLANLPFRKMNGLGNDFVVLDGRVTPVRVDVETARAIADRARGIGCDQLIVLEQSRAGADLFMRIVNADGSEVSACGNATRCIGRLVMDETGADHAVIETRAGRLVAFDGGAWHRVTVDMGEPRLRWDEIPLSEPFHDTRMIELQVGPIDAPLIHSPAVVSMGNPHAIFFVDDLDVIDLGKVGPMLENHPLFPERANISLAKVLSPEAIALRVWERGAGLTRACGTAACATGVAGVRKRLTRRKVTVHLPGGPLEIEWRESDGHVLMTGGIALDGDGTLSPDLFAAPAA